MAGDRLSDFAISGSCQHDTAAAGPFLSNKIKHLLSIGKMSGIDLGPSGEFAFAGGASRKQPEGEHDQQKGPSFQEGKKALPKHIPADQGVVEIDAQNR
jgi:hypothetical protein